MSEIGLRRYAAALVAVGLFLGVGLHLAASSSGFVEMDEVTHFLQAKFSFRHPSVYASAWARPVFLLLYCLPAQLSFTAARAFTVVIAALAAWIAFLLARQSAMRWPATALVFTVLQLRYAQQSFTVMTEHIGALMIALGVYLWAKGPRWLSCLLISLLPLARPEGAFLVPLWLILIAHDVEGPWSARARTALPLLVGPVLWIAASLVFTGDPVWFLHNFPSPWQQSGHLSLSRGVAFLARLPQFASVPVVIFAAAGIFFIRRYHIQLVAVVTGVVIALHTALRAGEVFGSTGYLRYLVPVSPLLAVIACAGWSATVSFLLGLRSSIRRAAAFALLIILLLTSYLWSLRRWPVFAVAEGPEAAALRCIDQSLARHGTDSIVFSSDNEWYLLTGRDPWDFRMSNAQLLGYIREDRLQLQEILPDLPRGTLVIADRAWMQRYSGYGDADLRGWGYAPADEIGSRCDPELRWYRMYRKQ